MGLTFPRFFAATALIALSALSHAQDTANASQAVPAEAMAFDLQIEAPQEIAQLLQRHMELQRYRVLTDLSDSEIQSLLTDAQQDAAGLLATLGYFSAAIQIRLLPPDTKGRKQVQITVAPGAQARVRAVDLVLDGAIATDEAAQAQRQSIRDLWSLASGEPFSQDAWDAAKAQALKQLVAKRYATGSLHSAQAEVDPDSATVDLRLQLDSG
ncbi:MAG: outer membrane protein assembly factor, partial [Rhodoferax sp.]|nr:outer membrane protein assembly factor [Rhodoferax sp.]